MAPPVSLLNLPIDCLTMLLPLLPLEDCYSVICTCRPLRDLALMFAMVQMFRLAYAPSDECDQDMYTSYAGLSKLLLSQPRPSWYLAGFLQRRYRGSNSGTDADCDEDEEWAARSWLTKRLLNACESLPKTPTSTSQIYNLCYAMCTRKGEEEERLCGDLYRQLLIRCYDADVIVRQCLRLTRRMVTELPSDKGTYFRAASIIDSALPRLVTFCREATAAADLLADEHLFYLQCGFTLQLYSDSWSRNSRIRELTEVHQTSAHRTDCLSRLLSQCGLQIAK